MKEGEEGAPSSFVTPRKRKKRGATDFSNRKARQRREALRKKGLVDTITGTPLKGRGGGFCASFCSIRKLVIDSIVESEEEVIVEIENERDQDYTCKSASTELEMAGGRRGRRKQTIVSPQPSISQRNSTPESQSSKEFHSDTVSLISYLT